MTASLPPAVAGYLAAVNSVDVDAMVAAFAPDAYNLPAELVRSGDCRQLPASAAK